MAFQWGEFFSCGMQLANVCVTVVCILVAVRVVLVVPRALSFRCALHFSHMAGCFCLRNCSKFVVLLPLLATDLVQTLQWGVVWSKSVLANQFQIKTASSDEPVDGALTASQYRSAEVFRAALSSNMSSFDHIRQCTQKL